MIPPVLEQLHACLRSGDLPGRVSHRRLAPDGRGSDDEPTGTATLRYAAVLVAVFDADDPSVLLIRRPDDGTPHAGELAFPGGRYEAGETFPVGTALREAQEEIALDPDRATVLGVLSPIYIPVSNFRVVPVVAWVDSVDEVVPSDAEVAEIVALRLRALRMPPERRIFATRWGDVGAPCWVVSETRPDLPPLWGASAMVASELIDACGKS